MGYLHGHVNLYLYIYIYIYMYVCMESLKNIKHAGLTAKCGFQFKSETCLPQIYINDTIIGREISVQYNIPTVLLFPAKSRWKCVLEGIMGLCWGGISRGIQAICALLHIAKNTSGKAWWIKWMATEIILLRQTFCKCFVICLICFSYYIA